MSNSLKHKGQKHQNKTAFKIVFDTQALQHQKKVSLKSLCQRCTEQMQWKLQYNKYRKATEAGKCNICLQKNVYRSYMKACQQCIEAKNVCAKCLIPEYQAPEQVKLPEQQLKKIQKGETMKQVDFMKTLQQRSRRTIRRQLQKGVIKWSPQEEYFVDQQGKKMVGLKFRKGFTIDGSNVDEDDIDIGDDDINESQQQQKAQKRKASCSSLSKNDSNHEGDQVQCDQNDKQDDQDWQDEQK